MEFEELRRRLRAEMGEAGSVEETATSTSSSALVAMSSRPAGSRPEAAPAGPKRTSVRRPATRGSGSFLAVATLAVLALAGIAFVFAAGSYYVMPQAFPFVPAEAQMAMLERRTLAALGLLGLVSLVLVLYALVVFGAMRSILRDSGAAEASLRAVERGLSARIDALLGTLSTRAISLSGGADDLRQISREIEKSLREANGRDDDRWRQVAGTLGLLAGTLERKETPAQGDALEPLFGRLDGLDDRIAAMTDRLEAAVMLPRPSGDLVVHSSQLPVPVPVDMQPVFDRLESLRDHVEALAIRTPSDVGFRDHSEDRSISVLGPRVTALAATIDGLAERLGPTLDRIQAAMEILASRPGVDMSRVHDDLAVLKRDMGSLRLETATSLASMNGPLEPAIDEIRRGMDRVLDRLARSEDTGIATRSAINEALATLQVRLTTFDEAFGPAAALARLDEIGSRVSNENRMTRLATDAIAPQLRSHEASIDIVRNQGERLMAAIEALSGEVAGFSRPVSGGNAQGEGAESSPQDRASLAQIETMLAGLGASVDARLAALEATVQTAVSAGGSTGSVTALRRDRPTVI